jgi:uncharacterized protein (DUF2062 family)
MKQPDAEIKNGNQSWWRRWLLRPVLAQLTQGISVDRLAWTIALGIVFGVFPIMGSTTLVCFLVGYLFRLNQPVLHVFKTAVYPLHLALILVFIHLGERLFGVPSLSFSIPELLSKFKEDPLQFARDFGMAAFHGVLAWAVIAPVAAITIKVSILPMLNRLRNSLESKKEVLP